MSREGAGGDTKTNVGVNGLIGGPGDSLKRQV